MTRVPGEGLYRVTGELIIVRCAPDGAYHHLYKNAPVPATADPIQIRSLLADGMIERVHPEKELS